MMKRKNKSLGVNAALNGIRNILSIIFPLITFPYISRVLQVDNIGKYNFSLSTVNYFILIAGLGISTYAIREGAKYRDDYEKISQFSSEIFTINITSMILSVLALLFMIIVIPKFEYYRMLILIFSFEIIFRTIGKEWLFSIFEEYAYITKRSILFHILSILLLFIFVKNDNDLYKYAMVTVIANAGNNLINYFYAKKFCKIHLVRNFDWKHHLKPILIIFATSIATTVYVNSDITILGFLSSDYYVGLYTVSAKIYKIVKTALSAVLIVSIPRLSNYIGTGQTNKYNQTFNKIFNIMIFFVFPAVTGLFMLSQDVILVIAGKNYLESTLSLQILCGALLVCMFGWLFNSCVLIPYKCEKKVLIATITSAILNVILNLILIPLYKQNAASFTTIISEACSMIMCIVFSKGLVKVENYKSNIISVLFGCIGIIISCEILRHLNTNRYLYIILSVVLSSIVYCIILLMLDNKIIKEIFFLLKSKLFHIFPQKV